MKTATSVLLFSVFALLALSVMMLVSAATAEPKAHYLAQQPIWCAVGLAALGLAAASDYRWLKRFEWLPLATLAFAAALLGLVLVPGIGRTINGATRWLAAGNVRFQPSEFAKLALIVALAWYGERYQRHLQGFWRGTVVPFLMAGVVLALIFKEPDVGTVLLLAAVSSVMLLIAGMRWSYFLPACLAALIGIAAFVVHDPNRSGRIYSWLHLEETKLDVGMQVYRARVAMGSGGIAGRGPGESRMKLQYLPEHHTDFIFAIIGEELGLGATLGLIAVYLAFLVCGLYIASHAADMFGLLTGSGITFLIGLQAFINIGVVTGALPNKGLALPFLSYGGSSLVALLLGVGLLISIGRHAGEGLPLTKGVFGRRNPFAAPAAEAETI